MNSKDQGNIMRDRLTYYSSFYMEAEKQLNEDPAHKKYWSLKLKEAGEEIDKIAGEMLDAD